MMDDKKLADFRDVLLARKSELEELSAMTRDDRAAVELDQTSVGRLSRMDAMQGQAMAQATERQREQQISRIKSALARIDDGDFGYCIACDEPIAEKRLQLDPAVPTCIDCASKAGR